MSGHAKRDAKRVTIWVFLGVLAISLATFFLIRTLGTKQYRGNDLTINANHTQLLEIISDEAVKATVLSTQNFKLSSSGKKLESEPVFPEYFPETKISKLETRLRPGVWKIDGDISFRLVSAQEFQVIETHTTKASIALILSGVFALAGFGCLGLLLILEL